MSFKIKGILHQISESEAKTSSFTSREFVMKTQDGNFEQFIKFQLTQDYCSVIDHFTAGQEVTVHFSLRGKEWQGKYFTNLNAWKIEREGNAPTQPEKQPETAQAVDTVAVAESAPVVDDGSLPF